MFASLGHEVFVYASDGSNIEEYCDSKNVHLVQTHTLSDIRNDYGDGWNLDTHPCIGYDYTAGSYREDFCAAEKKPSTKKFYASAIAAINANKQPDDFLLLSMGIYHKPVADAVQIPMTCEPGIGYRGSYCRYRAYESHYLRSYMDGVETQNRCTDGNNYTRVIPNYFDPRDFEYAAPKGDYVLYIGRMIWRKGIVIAYEAAKQAGVKLILAGQGGQILGDGSFASTHDPSMKFPAGNWEYFGHANARQRSELMHGAIATMVPTIYMEPFAGVHVESIICGTPAITSNFGVFPGTIPDHLNGIVGYRCDTLQDYVDAIHAAKKDGLKNRDIIRKYGERFHMSTVRHEFQKWFQDIYNVHFGKGWYQLR